MQQLRQVTASHFSHPKTGPALGARPFSAWTPTARSARDRLERSFGLSFWACKFSENPWRWRHPISENGLKIEIDGEPYTIVYFQHVKPGKGGAFVRTKIKNLRNGKVVEKTFRAGEKVGEPDIEDRKMQYLYADAESLIFMDT